MSDTHMFHLQEPLDPVDLLIHCGDATNSKNLIVNEMEFKEFYEWWVAYPATYKLFVPGNHDMYCETPKFNKFVKYHKDSNYKFVTNGVVEIEGLRIFCNSYTPRFHDWAFNVDRDKMYKRYKLLGPGVDIVVSHGPPRYILDYVPRPSIVDDTSFMSSEGCLSFSRAIEKALPKHVFFGHIHGNNKFENNGTLIRGGVCYHNCSQVLDNLFDKGLFYNGKILSL